MNETNGLIILQSISLTASVCMALMLGLSRLLMRNRNGAYEKVRGMLIAVSVILALHYWAQLHFGFRAMGDDVGAVVNILFYTPVAYLLFCSVLKISCGNNYSRKYQKVAVASMAVIAGIFITGLMAYHSMHMNHALYCMGAVFFITMLFFIIAPAKKIKQMKSMVESQTGVDLQTYRMYMSTGVNLMLYLSALVPIIIFSKYLLAIVGPLFLMALFFFMLCFIAMGFNISFMEIINDTEQKEDDLQVYYDGSKLTDAFMKTLDEKVKKWIEMRGFSNPNMNIQIMAKQLDIDKKILSQYIFQRKGITFRVWLSDLRIGEAMRLLSDEKGYTNEMIASECGFSSRSWMQQRFKAVTGMTPSEWKETR